MENGPPNPLHLHSSGKNDLGILARIGSSTIALWRKRAPGLGYKTLSPQSNEIRSVYKFLAIPGLELPCRLDSLIQSLQVLIQPNWLLSNYLKNARHNLQFDRSCPIIRNLYRIKLHTNGCTLRHYCSICTIAMLQICMHYQNSQSKNKDMQIF